MANKLVKLHRSQNHRMIAGVLGGYCRVSWLECNIGAFVVCDYFNGKCRRARHFDIYRVMDCHAKCHPKFLSCSLIG